ncbi:peptidyl-prolyl cis-trans isomerase [Spirochaetia bacterium]|nr:peptidyl-prolyl cis-trans isomerase [Spirochaetia bacterium]
MKILAGFLCILSFVNCNGSGKSESGSSAETTFDKDTSYAMGVSIGSEWKANNIIPDADEFIKGFKDAFGSGKTRFSAEEAGMKIQQAFMARQEKEAEGIKQIETDFLAENSKKPGITITGSGLQYEVIGEGSGSRPAASDTVRVNYEGKLISGEVFDSSYERGEPVEFPLDMVIPGWTEGIQLMSVGSKYRFYIPSELAYGPQGGGPIPPYSPLIFEVELLGITK